MSKSDEVTTIDWRRLKDAEKQVVVGFMLRGPLDRSTLEFIQCEVPLGIQRADDAIQVEHGNSPKRNEAFALSSTELVRDDGTPRGFWNAKDLSDKSGWMLQSLTGGVDAIAVNRDEVHLLEVKTVGEKIESPSSVYKPLGQIQFYTSYFQEDYPEICRHRALKRWLITTESDVDMELIRPILTEHNVGFFDDTRPDCTIVPEQIE